MPAHDCLGADQDETILPLRPNPLHADPKDLIAPEQLRMLLALFEKWPVVGEEPGFPAEDLGENKSNGRMTQQEGSAGGKWARFIPDLPASLDASHRNQSWPGFWRTTPYREERIVRAACSSPVLPR